MKRYLKRGFLIAAMFFVAVSYTGAYFSDSVAVSGNTFTAATWDVPEPTESVVINELMWMGSIGQPFDEWIELRNMTSSTVDLSDWMISKNSGTETAMLTLPLGASISPGGYYLISNYSNTHEFSALGVVPDYITSSVELSNTALQIKLYSGAIDSANLVDTAGDGGTPLGGLHGADKQSMSRKLSPADGTIPGSWYSDTTSNSIIYWKAEGGNYGTPGGPNV